MDFGEENRRHNFVLPFDVLCEVIDLADKDSLRELSVVNRECHYRANKYLWQTLVLRGDYNALQIGAEMILRDTSRAKCVRKISITLSEREPYEEVSGFHSSLHLICRSLQHTQYLRDLDIRVEGFYSEVAHMLSSHDFPFELEVFRTNLYYTDGLGGFLMKHSEIRDFTQLTRRSMPGSMSSELLPHIRSLSYPMFGIVDMVRGRPVSRMALDLRSEENLVDGLQAISLSSVDVLDLKLTIHNSAILHPFLLGLATRAPSLKNLTVTLQSYAAFSELQHDTYLSTLHGIKAHPSLQSICWRGLLVPPNVHKPALYCGPKLRKVEVFAIRPQLAFERIDSGSEWIDTLPKIQQKRR